VSKIAYTGSGRGVEPTALDWDSVEVRDGTLDVGLTAPPGRAWASRFRSVLVMLDRVDGGWGEVRLRRATVTVSEVREGSEARLRHLLDSAVVEANGEPGSERPTEDADEQRSRDRRMTDAFRGGGHG
jgi:hypothetical protein